MSEAENAPHTRNSELSVIALALRVLRGEITEAQAIAIVQGKVPPEIVQGESTR